MEEEKKVYSHFEVSAHKSVQDCWVIINAKVYNITSFLKDHPGGDDVLLSVAGKDASEEFEAVGHGSVARLMLDEFYTGEVNPTIIKHVIKTSIAPQARGSTKLWYLVPITLGLVASIWYGIEPLAS